MPKIARPLRIDVMQRIPIPGRLTTSSLKTLTVVVFFFDSPHLCRRQRQKADRRPWSDLQYIETDAYQRHFFWLLRAKLLFTMGQFKEKSKLPCYCCLFELEASQRGFCSRFQQTKMTYFSTFRSAVRHADWRPFRHRYREWYSWACFDVLFVDEWMHFFFVYLVSVNFLRHLATVCSFLHYIRLC